MSRLIDPDIYLYGPSGSGKSTIGRILADNLGWRFVDLDEAIEKQAGRKIAQIFQHAGESEFRRLESEMLHRTAAEISPAVIALGGGALLDSANLNTAQENGRVICLTASLERLYTRLQLDENVRPLLAEGSSARLEAYLSSRAQHYARFRDSLDTTDLTPAEAAWELQIYLGMFRVRGMGPGYDVRVRTGGLSGLADAVERRGLRGPFGLVSDSHTGPLYAGQIEQAFHNAGEALSEVRLPAGEAEKTIATVGKIWAGLLAGGLERRSTVLALGGGVVGDLAGFAASAYLRGIAWVALPTSLLAMVDASLGGKTGADLPQGKNLVGAFHAPGLVLADPAVLETLPDVELRSGLAEVVKHSVIGDPGLFERLMAGVPGPDSWERLVSRAMAVKLRIIGEDPYEGGRRAALNLGHTIGHAVEHVSGYQVRHGEAVAIGLVAEARLAEHTGLAESGLAARLAGCLEGLGLPTEIPADLDRQDLRTAMQYDKKKAAGEIRFALPVAIGDVRTGIVIEDLRMVL